jgi:Cytochrome P460
MILTFATGEGMRPGRSKSQRVDSNAMASSETGLPSFAVLQIGGRISCKALSAQGAETCDCVQVMTDGDDGLRNFVQRAMTTVQFMVKDSKKYVATGGWGFSQFNDGKPVDAAGLGGCFACHVPVKDRDFQFTRYTP